MDIGLIICYIWIGGFGLIFLPTWFFYLVDSIRREVALKKERRIDTIRGFEARSNHDIWVDATLDDIPIVISALFWPIVLLGALGIIILKLNHKNPRTKKSFY